MSRFVLVFCLASTVIAWASPEAEASKLGLSYFSRGDILYSGAVQGWVDVTDGLPEIVHRQTWVAAGDGTTRTFGGPIELSAYLYEGEGPLSSAIAEVTLKGVGTGKVAPWGDWGAGMSTANGSGSAVVTELRVAPGVDPSRIPAWLSGLQLTVSVGRTGNPGPPDRVATEVRISAVPVPEPGSTVVFLAAAGAGLAMARRRPH